MLRWSLMKDMVIKTKFVAPKLKNPLFPRKRLREKKILEYPLTVICASPGFGKTTFLVDLCQSICYPYFWYSLDIHDRDIYSFLLHLIHLFRQTKEGVGDEALELLPGVRQDQRIWSRPLESLVNDLQDHLNKESLLILDGYHVVGEEEMIRHLLERFVEIIPENLHLILSSREVPPFCHLVNWRARDRILEIKEEDLALTREEVGQFFLSQYNYHLTEEEVTTIYQGTRGWIMALDMAWRGSKKGQNITQIFKKPYTSLPVLFEFLALEVLDYQSPSLQDFLLKTSILRELDGETCNYLRGAQDSEDLLTMIQAKGLLTMKYQGSMYYHPLFKDFLEERLREDRTLWYSLNLKMAHYYQDGGEGEKALYHLLKAGDEVGAARFILQHISHPYRPSLPILRKALEKLSSSVLQEFPRLLLFQGDLERYASSYIKALESYQKALQIFKERDHSEGLKETYERLAMVYLDTVQPVKAEEYLLKGLSLKEEEERRGETSLLGLLAENRANQGDLSGARQLMETLNRVQEDTLPVQQEIHLKSRLLLRTGRIKEGVHLLTEAMEVDSKEVDREPLTHREGPLVLSLLYSLCGEKEKALQSAEEGLLLAKSLNSPFTEAVGYMRLGHAWQLFSCYKKSMELYQKALKGMDSIGVVRGRAEGLWGLTLVCAYLGEGTWANSYGEECCSISMSSGDAWMASQGRLALGINAYLLGQYQEALESFTSTLAFFTSCHDLLGQALSHLYLSLLYDRQGESSFREELLSFLRIAREEEYSFLFHQVTLTGPRDLCLIYPLFLSLLEEISPEDRRWVKGNLNLYRYDYHPGYTLHIKTLGFLQIFRGHREVKERDWKREKARELCKLLVTYRQEFLPRERIVDLLWPREEKETTLRDFKVALNALNSVFEPERQARSEPFFILRRDQAYGLNLRAPIIIDADLFEKRIQKGISLKDPDLLEEGIDLYQGEYLSFSLYYDWLREPREVLSRLFFYGSETLAHIYLKEGEAREALKVAERMLSFDSCWEVAYQLAIEAYLMMDKKYLAKQMYLTCARTLEEELAVEPLPSTRRYLEVLFGPQGLMRYYKELDKGGR